MKQKIEEKLKAIKLRKQGHSVNEIVEKVRVAKSSVSVWVRNVQLDDKAKDRLLTKIKLGQLVSAENKRKKTKQAMDNYHQEALRMFETKKLDRFSIQFICSLIYHCEGNKDLFYGINFTNSDPNLIKTFLFLLRYGFDINEKKLRVCIHLHGYHNPKKQINFWSKITNIPKRQFIKPYLKSNTGKRIRENYQGCVSVRYHSADTARHLAMIAKAFLTKYN